MLGDVAERHLDGRFVDRFGVVRAHPFDDVGVIRVLRIGDGLELVIEAENAAAVLGRCVALTADIARIGDAAVRPVARGSP